MVKKNLSVITLILAVLILVLGYVLYEKYIVPFNQNNSSKTRSIVLDKDHHLVLTKQKDQGKIFSLELEITGNAADIVEIIISNPSKTTAYNARIKGGEIDFDYINDWYDDTCILDIQATKTSSDKLTIESRFIGTK
ncbi:MAG: hypothetical protein ACI865_001638 [Flavobacteriaceae bacterium]|jgi:hypothetical protein